jgi:hypothetical protein
LCRTAFDAIAERELARLTPQLRGRRSNNTRDGRGRARRLGLAVLERIDPAIRGKLLPKWLDDPEFRRDAVEHAILQGDLALKEKQNEPARQAYEQAFLHARESDQVLQSVAKLKGVGQVVDPITHLGFINRWWLVGPFPAPAMTGFAAEFPPEKQVDLAAEYSGEGGQKLRWKCIRRLTSLVKPTSFKPLRGERIGQRYAEIESPQNRVSAAVRRQSHRLAQRHQGSRPRAVAQRHAAGSLRRASKVAAGHESRPRENLPGPAAREPRGSQQLVVSTAILRRHGRSGQVPEPAAGAEAIGEKHRDTEGTEKKGRECHRVFAIRE